MTFSLERWKRIPGLRRYKISNFGRVKYYMKGQYRLKRLNDKKAYGHQIFRTYDKLAKKRRSHYVHKVVLEVFVGPRPKGMECSHLDGKPWNNHVSNLRWVTHKENMSHRVVHGTLPLGECHYKARITEEDVKTIRMMCESRILYRDIAYMFEITRNHVVGIRRRRSWKHI